MSSFPSDANIGLLPQVRSQVGTVCALRLSHQGLCIQFLAGSSYKILKCPAKYFFCSDIWSLTLVSNIELLNALKFPWYQECVFFSDEILDGFTVRTDHRKRQAINRSLELSDYHSPILQKEVGH